ncbi:MAG: hypothetical protein Q4F85_06770 [Prevotella sp.]|nr:hypothetical protein [Prevotella sp.]
MSTMPNKEQIREYLISNAIDKMVEFLIVEKNCTIDQAMDKVYKSETIKRLQNEEGELYIQSSSYICELLNGELLKPVVLP